MTKLRKRRESIIQAAKSVFLEKGLMNTVMDDIALECGITRRTLYRYFATRDELAFTVTQVILGEWNEFIQNEAEEMIGTGFECLNELLLGMVEYMKARPGIMKYLGEFDYLFHEESPLLMETGKSMDFKKTAEKSDFVLLDLIKKGINDNSISDQFDPYLLESTISNVLWGFGQRISIRGDIIKQETGFQGYDMIDMQLQLYLKALKK